MPTFDITSEFNQQEVVNAVDQAHREISNRYDFRKSGIDQVSSKKIIALIRENNKKIQCAYQNQQIRVNSKKRDDLQEVIQMVKDSKLEIPLNYGNFRD